MTSQSVVGTRGYMAPEMFIMQCQMKRGHYVTDRYTNAVDWFSLGVTIYRFLTGLNPFAKADFAEAARIDSRSMLRLAVINIYKSVLSQLNYNTFSEYTRLIQFIQRLLELDPSIRINSLQVKQHAVFSHINWQELDKKSITPPPFKCLVRDVANKYNDVLSFDRLLETENKLDWLSLENNPINIYQEYFDFWNYASMDAIVDETVNKKFTHI